MKPILEEINAVKNSSFRVKRDVLPYLNIPLHFHPELELVYIVKGKGKRFVGDCIENFSAGDLVFLGSNLPHVWLNDEEHYQGNKNVFADVIVIHFKENAFGKFFFNIPEMKLINNLFEKATHGVSITGKTNMIITEKMIKMVEDNESNKFISLIQLLDLISKNQQDHNILSKGDYTGIAFERHGERLNNVFRYISENYDQNISLEDISKIANMNKSAFCRYFKQVTSKSFTEYLNEIRINYAKKLIISRRLAVLEVGYLCGFNNPSYFNKQFKKTVGKTPLEYLEDSNNE